MISSANIGFDHNVVVISIAPITTRGTVTQEVLKSKKYRQIASSIEHLGLVEPLVVSPIGDGAFLLLDGALLLRRAIGCKRQGG